MSCVTWPRTVLYFGGSHLVMSLFFTVAPHKVTASFQLDTVSSSTVGFLSPPAQRRMKLQQRSQLTAGVCVCVCVCVCLCGGFFPRSLSQAFSHGNVYVQHVSCDTSYLSWPLVNLVIQSALWSHMTTFMFKTEMRPRSWMHSLTFFTSADSN